jgi:hypothetical protein
MVQSGVDMCACGLHFGLGFGSGFVCARIRCCALPHAAVYISVRPSLCAGALMAWSCALLSASCPTLKNRDGAGVGRGGVVRRAVDELWSSPSPSIVSRRGRHPFLSIF